MSTLSQFTAFCPQCGYLTTHTPGRKCPLCNRGTVESTAPCTTTGQAAPARESHGRAPYTYCVRCRSHFWPQLPYQAHCSDACFEADSSPID